MPKTISATEAARRLGCELNYLYNLVRTGRLEACKEGKQWCIPVSAVGERLQRLGKAQASTQVDS